MVFTKNVNLNIILVFEFLFLINFRHKSRFLMQIIINELILVFPNNGTREVKE